MHRRIHLATTLVGALLLAGCGSTNYAAAYRPRLAATQERIDAGELRPALGEAESILAETLPQLPAADLPHFFALVLAANINFDAAASEPFLADRVGDELRSAQMAHAVAAVVWAEGARGVAERLADSAAAAEALPDNMRGGAWAERPIKGSLDALDLRALAAEARFGFAESVGDRLQRLLPEARRDRIDMPALVARLETDFGLAPVEQFWVLYGLHVWSRELGTLPTNSFRLGHWAYFLGRGLDVDATSDEYRAALAVGAWLTSPYRDLVFDDPEDGSAPNYEAAPTEPSQGSVGTPYWGYVARPKPPQG